jgi:V/A-type H+-transporting ATPase subunit C
MPGALKKYGFINAKLRARIGKILSEDFFQRMARSSSLTEAAALLRDTDFAVVESTYNKTGDLKMGELALIKREIDLYLEIVRLLEGGVAGFVRALSIRYEIENLKHALRLWFDRSVRNRSIQDSVGYIYRGAIYHSFDADEIINADDVEGVTRALRETPYARILEDKEARFKLLKSLFPFEVALDHYYYRQLLSETEKLAPRDREIAKKIIGVEIDLMNVNWMIRFKNSFNLSPDEAVKYIIPQGQDIDAETVRTSYESPVELLSSIINKRYTPMKPLLTTETPDLGSRLVLIERLLEEIMLYEVRRTLSGYPFTVGVVLAYFLLKRNEIKKVMTILNAKYYSLSEERIKSVL